MLQIRQSFKPYLPSLTKSVATCAIVLTLALAACSPAQQEDTVAKNQEDPVAKNIAHYSHVWDEIINNGNLDMFNSDNFTADVVVHASPEDIVGIEAVRGFYANYVTGFSDIQFTVKDIFGQGDKLVKYWHFKGTHTGDFFGIPATGKSLDIEGTTLVLMKDGKIAEERDFFDNLEFSQQLGLIPR